MYINNNSLSFLMKEKFFYRYIYIRTPRPTYITVYFCIQFISNKIKTHLHVHMYVPVCIITYLTATRTDISSSSSIFHKKYVIYRKKYHKKLSLLVQK